MFKKKLSILFIMMCAFFTSCSNKEEIPENKIKYSIKENQEKYEIEHESVESEVKKISENTEKVHNEEKSIDEQFISHASSLYDFEEDIVQKHKILEYDICTSTQYNYSDTALKEYLIGYIESDKEMSEKLDIKESLRLRIDYHLFDFNDDGYEDYLVCLDGIGWNGSGGHVVNIFIQEMDGTLRKILGINLRLHSGYDEEGKDTHSRFTVLDEKTNGYYAIVLPESNRILRYDKETGCYEFHEDEQNAQSETEKNTQYTCNQVEEGYEVKLYDKNNQEIYSEVYPKEPWIKEVTENILEIGISTGSPSSYVFYFDRETSKISDVYFNAILLDNKYVAYMENSEELIITDIF